MWLSSVPFRPRIVSSLLPLALAPFLSGCGDDVTGSDDGSRECTRETRPAIFVEVRDASTGGVVAGAAATAIDGAFRAPLQAFAPGLLGGPPERPGTYTVQVTGAGYLPVELTGVVVGSDDCHVLTVTLQANLVPAEDPPCVDALIAEILAGPPSGASVTRAMYGGQVTYYVTEPCCDFLNPLYDSSCRVLCHPDGGINGQGDRLCPDYYDTRWDVQVIWEDPRQ